MSAMPWYAWLLIAVYAVKVIASPFWIGQPREPITAKDCAVSMVIAGLIIWDIVELAT